MNKLRERLKRGRFSTADVLRIYDKLETVELDFMIGKWRGFEIKTNHEMDGLLELTGWYGKLFLDYDTVYPLLYYTKDSLTLYSVDPIKIPFISRVPKVKLLRQVIQCLKPLLQTKESRARIRMTDYRGKLSATMIYDNRPINDVFRKIDKNTLIGAMDYKGMPQPYFFLLERDKTPMKIRI